VKNLLIYIHPECKFGEEETTAIKIQIDNSLDLGWKPDDIILCTNFEYEYNGVRAEVLLSDHFCEFCPPASKVNVFITLCRKKLKDEIYWFHDLDVYQLEYFDESNIGDFISIAICNYGRRPKFNTGSIFFKRNAKDIFRHIKFSCYKHLRDEEWAFRRLILEKEHLWDRVKVLNISYNFTSFNFGSNYRAAEKPLKTAHFHFDNRPVNPKNPKPNQIDFFLLGKNKYGIQIVPERLLKIFRKHGVI